MANMRKRFVRVVLVSTLALGCSGDERFGDGQAAIEKAAVNYDGQCVKLYAEIPSGSFRFLDAYTHHDGDVVTRPVQSGDTQVWCLTRVSGGLAGAGPYDVYAIQHRSFSGQYLDAYTTNDHKAVLRDYQNDKTQRWVVTGNFAPIKQQETGRFLNVLPTAQDDYRAVTTSAPLNWAVWPAPWF